MKRKPKSIRNPGNGGDWRAAKLIAIMKRIQQKRKAVKGS